MSLVASTKQPSDADIRNTVRQLLLEIKIDDKAVDSIADQLDEVKDWEQVLSGGQKKKVALISALIEQPEILVLDEVFAGMDPGSVINSQGMIKKYLPESTLILSVDQNIEQNNYNGFYQKRLQLENKTFVVSDF